MTEFFEALPFYPELTPSWISCVLTALGRSKPDIAEPYRFLILGADLDFHLALTAAANPTGHFVGVDLNPFAESEGAAIGWKAGLKNLHFLKKSLRELAIAPSGSLEKFDFIVVDDNKIDFGDGGHPFVLSFVRRFLKDGGVLALRYATDPLGAFFPLAEQMIEKAGLFDNPALEPSLGVLQRIAKKGSAESKSPKALFSADIISLLQGMGLDYVGSGEPLENVDSAYLPDHALTLLGAIKDLALREAVKDIIRDQGARFDLYQKNGVKLSASDHMAALAAQVFVSLPGAPATGGMTFETPTGIVKGSAELFAPVLEALHHQPQSLGMLMHMPEFSKTPGLLNQMFQMLLWANCVRPLLPRRIPEGPAHAFNRVVCDLALSGRDYGYLAAPALGGAVPAPIHAMLAACILEKQPTLRGEELYRLVADRLNQSGIDFGEQERQELSLWEKFILPQWVRFGVLALDHY